MKCGHPAKRKIARHSVCAARYNSIFNERNALKIVGQWCPDMRKDVYPGAFFHIYHKEVLV